MKRKILVTLLAFCLIASLCVVGAAADGTTLPAAVNGVITLTENVDVSTTGATLNNVVLDLNGHEIKAANTANGNIDITGNVVIRDSSDENADGNGTGRIYTESSYSSTAASGLIAINGSNSSLTIESGKIYTVIPGATSSSGGQFAVTVINGGNFTMNGGKIEAGWYAVSGNGMNTGYSEIVINGGTLISTVDYAIYHPHAGNLTVNGGVIQGAAGGISMNRGSLEVNDGTIISTGTGNTGTGADGTTGQGNAAVHFQGEYDNVTAVFNGGTIESSGNAALFQFEGPSDASRDVKINAGTYTGNITTDASTNLTISGENTVINGNITNGAEGDILITDGATINGTVTVNSSTGTTTILNSTVNSVGTGVNVIDSTVNGEIINHGDAVAIIGTTAYQTLQAAINAAEDNDTVTLVANVNEDIAAGTPLKVKKDITIEGKGKTISLTLTNSTASDGRDKILQVEGEKAKLTLNDVTLDIDGFVGAANDRVCGDAIDLYLGGDLEANNSTIDIDGVAAAFVIQTAGETIVLNNTTVTADNVRGNGSQGGEWTLNNSSISFTNCGDNAFSVETATINSSDVVVNGSGLCGIMGADISIINGSTVTVTGSGKKLPQKSIYAPNGDAYNYAVELKKNGKLTVEDSILTLSGNVNDDGVAIDNIFVSAGTTTDTANGTVNAGFAVVEGSDQLVVRMMDGNVQYSNQTVTKGDSVYLPTLSKSGYTFTGWRVNNSNTIVKGGESYPITANTTFTAVWNMIMIPDTYDIVVDQPAHGTVDVSFSNASQGSVITVTATPDEGYELVYITVDGEPISGNSFVMPDHAVEVSALFAEIGKEVNFVDVSRADWFYDYVQYVAQNGLMEGTTRTAFEPNASMTRAMFWTVLARIDGETITGDAWKTLAQTWAVESGISDGTNADALITREQMVTMLYRYAGSPVAGGMAISEFTDSASVSDYATDAVTWALSEGILTGMGDGILAPQGTATRAQAAAMLMRFVEA